MLLSQIVFSGVLAFGAGIFFSSFFSLASLFVIPLLIGITFLTLFWMRRKMIYVGILCIAGALGMMHYYGASQLPEPVAQAQHVSFEARIVEPIERDEKGIQIVVQPEHKKGKVLLFASLFQEAQYGDYVTVSGKVQSPLVFEDFNYPLFLAKNNTFWVMFRPEIVVQEKGSSILFQLRNQLQERINASFAVPESSLLAAMLLGNKAGLPEEFKQDLNSTGTRHITAVSGMHVAILSGMLFLFLLNIGVSRKRSSLIVLLFLVFIVVFTGMQTSALRAGIMGSAFLVAGLVGRRNVSMRTLIFAGGGMLLVNPLLLGHDIGFQLSFLAVLGILLFLPVFQYWLRSLPNPFGVRDIVGMSIAAQLFTLPLVLYHFGIVSVISLLTNLLIVPLLPLVLFFGVVFLFLSMLTPILSSFLAFPLGLFLSYLSFVIENFARVPFASYSIEGFPFWVLAVFLIPASFLAWRFQQEQRFRFREETMIV